MALAIPVYALCCALGLRRSAALAAAALAVSVPGMMYATTLIAEPFAYPLALAALAAGTLALGGGAKARVAFLALAAAAALARVQLLVIPLAYIAAAVLVGLRSRSLRSVARQQAWVIGAIALPLVGLLLAPGILGIYGHSDAVSLGHGDLLGAIRQNGLVFLYASGWLIVPGALIGLAAAIARPRSQNELAFGALAVTFGLGLLLQASLWGETDRPQERYLIYAIPLVAAAFALTVDRGWPWRRAHGILIGATIAIAAAVPLSGYAASTIREHSPTLWGVATIEEHLGTATGSVGRHPGGDGPLVRGARVALPLGAQGPCSGSGSHPPPVSPSRSAQARWTSGSRTAFATRRSPPTADGWTTRTSATSPTCGRVARAETPSRS